MFSDRADVGELVTVSKMVDGIQRHPYPRRGRGGGFSRALSMLGKKTKSIDFSSRIETVRAASSWLGFVVGWTAGLRWTRSVWQGKPSSPFVIYFLFYFLI
jgi:hypothetical protein